MSRFSEDSPSGRKFPRHQANQRGFTTSVRSRNHIETWFELKSIPALPERQPGHVSPLASWSNAAIKFQGIYHHVARETQAGSVLLPNLGR